MRAWKPFNDSDDDWRRITPKSPSKIFAPWIKRYRLLEYLVLPGYIDWDYEGSMYDHPTPTRWLRGRVERALDRWP